MTDSNSPNRGPKDFWGVDKPADPAKPLDDAPADPGVWKTPGPKPETPRRKRRWLRWTLVGVGGSVVALVALAPTLAGLLAPSLAPGLIPIKGKLELQSASFGWFSGQNIGTTRLLDEKGVEVARFKVSTDAGLLGLVFGGRDLGKVKIEGQAAIVTGADGVTNLQRLFTADAKAPAPAGKPGGPIMLPKGLAAKVDAAFDVTYTDERDPKKSASLRGLAIKADVATGGRLTATVNGKAERAGGPGGDVKLSLTLENWSNADGSLTIDPANPLAADKPRADLTVEVANLPTGLLDAFSPGGPSLAAALGETLGMSVSVKGGMKDAAAALSFTTANVRAGADLTVRDGRVQAVKPIDVFVAGKAIAALSPGAAEMTKPGGPTTIDAFPDVTLQIADLSASLPKSGPLDLRGTAATVTVSTTATKGSLALAEGKRSAFEIAPLRTTVRTQDLAKSTTIKASTTATIDGKPAGVVDVDLATGSLLDAAGSPIKGLPPGLEGKLAVAGVATAIAQPFLAALPVDLTADLGPTLDLTLLAKAAAPAANARAGDLPPADLDLTVKSRDLDVDGAFTVAADSVKTRGAGLRLEGRSAARMAQRFLGKAPAWTLGPAGAASLVVRDLSIPLDANRKPLLAKTSGTIETTVAQWAATPKDIPGVVEVRSLTTTTTLRADQPVAFAARGAFSHEGKPFTLAADVTSPGLLTNDPAAPVNMDALLSTLAKVDLTGLPTSLAKLAPSPTAPPADPVVAPGPAPLSAADRAFLAENVIGPTIDLSFATAAVAGKGLSLTGSVASRGVSANLAGTLTSAQVTLTTITAEARLTPEAQRAARSKVMPDATDLPELTGPATFRLAVDPIAIPMKKGLAPDLDAIKGDLNATISAPGQVLVRVPPKPGQPALGTVGLKDFTAKATLPLQVAMGKKGERGAFVASLTAQALRMGAAGAPQDVGAIAASVNGEVTDFNPTPGSTLRVTASVKQLATAFLDELSGKAGYATGALGETASLDTRISIVPPTTPTPTWATLANGTVTAEADLTAPRLRTEKPIKVSLLPDRIAVEAGTTLTWTLDPAFAAVLLKPADAAQAASLRLNKATPITLALQKATIARGTGVGPLKPGIFDLDLAVTTPGVELTAKDGTTTKVTGLKLSAQRAEAGGMGGVSFALAMDQAQAGSAAPVSNIRIPGLIADLADGAGNVTPDNAKLTLVGELPAVPTVLLDTLAAQNGLLVEALGPVTTIKVNADRFGRPGGKLTALATSARASFDLAGVVKDQAFTNNPETPLKIGVSEITQDLSKRLVKGLPLFGSVEKNPKDRPASVTGTNLKLPLSNDLSKLDGDFLIDPGEINFQIAGDFADIVAAPILNAAKANASGVAGKKLTPMNVQIRSGVMTLSRWSVPVGEFTIGMDGTVNLATGAIDFTTYIPAGAIALEKLNLPGSGLGAIGADIIKNAVIPVRTTGTTAARKTAVDGDAAAKELLKGFDPGKLLDKGLKDLLKPKQPAPPPTPPKK